MSAENRKNRKLIYGATFLRAVANGMLAVLLGIWLGGIGFGPAGIGIVLGTGLTGAAGAALLATLAGDRIGRRRFLVGLAVLGAAGAFGFGFASDPVLVGALAFLGMLNGMGRDRGAALILEQAILPSTVAGERRTRAFAWYNVLQDGGHALGGLLGGLPAALRSFAGLGWPGSFRSAVAIYALLVLTSGLLYLRLSPAAEARGPTTGPRLTPASRGNLTRISLLFGVDSLAGGFLATALLAYYFFERFGAGEAAIGVLFFAARLANAGSHLAAARLAERFGLVNTMVFTHVFSSLVLVTVPLAPTFPAAAALFLLRESLVEMDVPTRQSYVMALVRPEERTFASGVTHLVRVAGWAVAPFFAGFFMQGISLATPLFLGASTKVGYDLLLWQWFRRLPPPEETARAGSVEVQ